MMHRHNDQHRHNPDCPSWTVVTVAMIFSIVLSLFGAWMFFGHGDAPDVSGLTIQQYVLGTQLVRIERMVRDSRKEFDEEQRDRTAEVRQLQNIVGDHETRLKTLADQFAEDHRRLNETVAYCKAWHQFWEGWEKYHDAPPQHVEAGGRKYVVTYQYVRFGLFGYWDRIARLVNP